MDGKCIKIRYIIIKNMTAIGFNQYNTRPKFSTNNKAMGDNGRCRHADDCGHTIEGCCDNLH
jgi:hypothetical protein